jgi:hypothetical protein
MRLALAASSVVLAACVGTLEGGVTGEPEGGRVPHIYNGQPDHGHPSAGSLDIQSPQGGGLCTGTLVGKRTVLTAAHCLKGGTGFTFNVGGQSYAVASAVHHPSFQWPGGNAKWYSEYSSYDVAVLRLASAPSNVAPTPVLDVLPAEGTYITLVGFGITRGGLQDSGVKRVGLSKLSQAHAGYYEYGVVEQGLSNMCNGDSGGPSFVTINGSEAQVGIHSAMDHECIVSGSDTRIDQHLDWIKQQAQGDVVVASGKGVPPQQPTPPANPPPANPLPPANPVPPPAPAGGYRQPCQSYAQCASRVCVDDGWGGGYCSYLCDWFHGCPWDAVCMRTQLPWINVCVPVY